jgi:hypothetical protein
MNRAADTTPARRSSALAILLPVMRSNGPYTIKLFAGLLGKLRRKNKNLTKSEIRAQPFANPGKS